MWAGKGGQAEVYKNGCSLTRPLAVLTLGSASILCFAQTNVLTYRNDNMRTAQNLSETILTLANVRPTTFGQLFTYPVDGPVDAQPLVVSGMTIGNKQGRNVVFTATENDSVYAFDMVTGATYWKVSVLGTGETPSDDRGCGQVEPTIGITSTPVIDLHAGPHGTIYLVGMTKDSKGGYHHRLHALDITTGAEQFGGPVEVKATYPGTGDNSTNGTVVFDPKQYKDRTALLLVNGVIYTSWASHCDNRPYTGWAMGYNETTLAQTSVLNLSPNGNEGAIWGAGGGVSADSSGNLFFDIANGTFDTTLNSSGFPDMGDYGNAFVKVALVGGVLTPLDYWTMDNTTCESNGDIDLGSGGVLLLPDLKDSKGNIRHLGTGAGKDANVYLFDRDNMGKFDSANNGTLYQELPQALAGGAWSSPAWFNGNLYYGGEYDVIRSFPMDPQTLMLGAPTSVSPTAYPYPGASPSISAHGTTNGILWTVENNTLAVLHAYDATNLGNELYNSNQAPSGRDQFGTGNKYITPVIANGTVLVGTPNSVAVFGLLSGSVSAGPPAIVSLSPNAGAGTSVTFRAIYSDPNGSGDLNEILLQVNAIQSSANACYVYYHPQAKLLYLYNNGAWMTPGLTPGVAGTASNSQCTLNAGSSSVTTAGNDLALSVALTFSGTVVGTKNVYLYAAGLRGQNSGWVKEGTWVPTSAGPPAIVSLSPNTGSGTPVTFKAVYSDPDGAGDLNEILLQVNAIQSSGNACYVYYHPQANLLYLYNNGAWMTPGLTLGAAGTASNTQCTLNAGSSSVTTAGNDLTLNVALTFSGTFVGSKNVYLYAGGFSGQNSAWVRKGTWVP
jgi:hypothetical protein